MSDENGTLRKHEGGRNILMRFGTIMALAAIVAWLSATVPGFLEGQNVLNILRQIALLAIISEGFTMCLIVGELDLAFPNVASLAGAVVAGLIFGGMHPFAASLIALSGGVLFGADMLPRIVHEIEEAAANADAAHVSPP